jgi:urease accessory protein
MAVGAGLGIAGVPLPWIEIGIAGSVVILGSMVALALKPSLAVSIALIGLFALLHGHSHGTALSQAASPVAHRRTRRRCGNSCHRRRVAHFGMRSGIG